LLISLSKFCCRKETWGYAKVIHKKEKKSWEKMNKCPRYLKQWVLRCLPEKKKKERWIRWPLFSRKNISKFQERDMFSRSKVELG
jgi:hypothetical protein